MLTHLLAALLSAAPITLEVTGDVAEADRDAIAAELVHAISRASPRDALTVRVCTGTCAPKPGVVLLELFEAVTLVRARATYGEVIARADLSVDAAERAPAIEAIARQLFPPLSPVVTAKVPAPGADWVTAPPEEPLPVLEVGAIGAGAIAMGVGVALWISGQSRLSELDATLSARGLNGLIGSISYDAAVAEHGSAAAQNDAGVAIALIGGAVASGALVWLLAGD